MRPAVLLQRLRSPQSVSHPTAACLCSNLSAWEAQGASSVGCQSLMRQILGAHPLAKLAPHDAAQFGPCVPRKEAQPVGLEPAECRHSRVHFLRPVEIQTHPKYRLDSQLRCYSERSRRTEHPGICKESGPASEFILEMLLRKLKLRGNKRQEISPFDTLESGLRLFVSRPQPLLPVGAMKESGVSSVCNQLLAGTRER